ncbi:hypothetical protein RchiOBHm_Chr7g0206291 [Rosa chinensis]|uniref:Uncharacterized protein n=1 Tax=Rosa chinensis TaxID=74649 RepID=A0A2P6P973_ROSCH|nr:hypothetical protein RchiOBHm_Chr7g0206291 [Rosa chinensis]
MQLSMVEKYVGTCIQPGPSTSSFNWMASELHFLFAVREVCGCMHSSMESYDYEMMVSGGFKAL